MWTKLRPFVHQFLEAASGMYEMYVYTMGERIYAQAMASLLDPSGRFFGSRVISQSDSTCRTTKDLDVMLGSESAVVILDDTEGVKLPSYCSIFVAFFFMQFINDLAYGIICAYA